MLKQILQKLTNEYVQDWGSPYDINCGGCEDWANDAFNLLKDTHKVEIWATPYFYAKTTHSFIRVDGKFYDAECLDGVDDHTELPIFQKLLQEYGRQPVWCEDANWDVQKIERDLSPETRKLIREEQIESGVEPEEALSCD
jgi:hypothetical protein